MTARKPAACPVCGRVVGAVLDGRTGTFTPNGLAAQPRDGWRCTLHARTLRQRHQASLAALASIEPRRSW